MSSLVPIHAEGLSAQIDPMGAQLFTLRDSENRDLLWDGDPTVWGRRAPLLFPIVGRLAGDRYHLDGRAYPLSQHGFARDRLFSLVETTSSSARFRLSWDEASLDIYPFRFQLDLVYAVQDASLAVTAEIANLGDVPIPASFGFHPGLRWPLPWSRDRAGHKILFERDEMAPIRRLDSKGLILAQTIPTPIAERVLPLRDSLFTQDALIFDAVASRRVWYGADSGPRLKIDFPDTPYLGLWTKPRAHFICIEPWHGHADPEGFHRRLACQTGDFPGRAQPDQSMPDVAHALRLTPASIVPPAPLPDILANFAQDHSCVRTSTIM